MIVSPQSLALKNWHQGSPPTYRWGDHPQGPGASIGSRQWDDHYPQGPNFGSRLLHPSQEHRQSRSRSVCPVLQSWNKQNFVKLPNKKQMRHVHCAMPEPCKNHSDCLYVMVPRLYWCDSKMIDNQPNDGEDEDEELESLRHGNCLLLVRVGLVLIP